MSVKRKPHGWKRIFFNLRWPGRNRVRHNRKNIQDFLVYCPLLHANSLIVDCGELLSEFGDWIATAGVKKNTALETQNSLVRSWSLPAEHKRFPDVVDLRMQVPFGLRLLTRPMCPGFYNLWKEGHRTCETLRCSLHSRPVGNHCQHRLLNSATVSSLELISVWQCTSRPLPRMIIIAWPYCQGSLEMLIIVKQIIDRHASGLRIIVWY